MDAVSPDSIFFDPYNDDGRAELALARGGFVDDRIVVSLAHCWCHILLFHDQMA